MMMFVTGEYFPFHLYPDKDIAKAIVQSRDDLCLKNLWRKAIQYYTIMSGNNENLFEAANRVTVAKAAEEIILCMECHSSMRQMIVKSLKVRCFMMDTK